MMRIADNNLAGEMIPGQIHFAGISPDRREEYPTIYVRFRPMNEAEAGAIATPAVAPYVSAPTVVSVADASAPISVCWHSSSVDVLHPVSAEAAAALGFAWQSTCPALLRTFDPPLNFLS